MKTRRILAGVVGATMALTLAGAAFAFADTTYLHQTGTAIEAGDFAGACDGPAVGANEIGWHFILNQTNDTSANGHFAFSDGDVEQGSTQQGNNLSWWVITDSGVTLNGSLTYTDGTTTGEFNLSHTCVGGVTVTPSPTPEVTPSPTPTLPENTPTPTLPQTNTIDQSNTGGPGTSLTLVFALILAIAGGLVAYAMRPRRVGNR